MNSWFIIYKEYDKDKEGITKEDALISILELLDYNGKNFDLTDDVRALNNMQNKFNMTQEQNIFIARRILVDSIYKSANLEGIAVTFAETIDILNNVDCTKLRPDEITAIINLRSIWQYILDNLDKDLDLGLIQKCNIRVDHRLVYPLGVFKGIDPLLQYPGHTDDQKNLI